MENKNPENVVEELLAWSKPEIKRLAVSLDTQFNLGSGGDFSNESGQIQV